MIDIKLSIILLYYNQDKYMDKIFKSIKYSNINCEVIVIDDNSEILFPFERIQAIIPNINIKLIRNEINTRNQSYCRNIGIKESTGDYITYLDGDDYYNSYELNKIFNNLENNDLYLTTILTQERYNKNIFHSRNIGIRNKYPSICIAQHIAKRKYILDNNLFWDEIKYNWDAEDLYYGMYVMTKTQDIKILDYNFYFHKKHNNSNSDRKNKDFYNYVLYLTQMYEDVIKLNNIKYLKVFESVVNNTVKTLQEMEF